MIEPTLSLLFLNDPSLGSWGSVTFDSDLVYPISFSYGFTNPFSNVAGVGSMQLHWDNSSSDRPYTDTNSALPTTQASKGVGAKYTLRIAQDTDIAESFGDLFSGVVTEWNALPGIAEDRITEVVCKDYMFDLGRYNVNMLEVHSNADASVLMKRIVNNVPLSDTDMMPYFIGNDYSSNGEVFTLAFQDLKDGASKATQAVANIANSEIGKIWVEGQGATGTPLLYYKTHQDWINRGRGSIGTLDNQYIDLAIGKNEGLERAPIFVTANPSVYGDTDEIVASQAENFTVYRNGGKKTVRLNYRDPNNENASVTVIDTDIITPVDGVDYTYANVPSSDLVVTFTNLGSAGEYDFVCNCSTNSATITNLQVRGMPLFQYDKITLVSSDGNPAAQPLRVNMPYQDDVDFAEDVLNFYRRLYSRYPSESVATSVSFVATVDSDMMAMAINGKIGKSFKLIEDVTKTDNYYRIIGVSWDIYAPNNIVVTWNIWPSEYTALHMVETSSDGGDHFTDSDGNRFAFWR